MSEAEDVFGIDNIILNTTLVNEFVREGSNAEFLLDPEGYKKKLMMKIKASGSKRYIKVMQDYYKNKITDVLVHVDNEKKDMAKMANNNSIILSTNSK